MVSTVSCPQPVATHPNLAIVSMMVPLRATDFDRVRYVHAHLPILLSGAILGSKRHQRLKMPFTGEKRLLRRS